MSFSRPFRGFSFEYAAFSCIWLIFMVPMLWSYFSAGIAHPGLAILCIAAFIAVYGFGFGTAHYYPRGWSAKNRLLLFFGLLAAIAGASIFILGFGALAFVPYLCAYVAYLAPTRVAIAAVAALCIGGFGLTMLLAPQLWTTALFNTAIIPMFVLVMALLNTWSENRAALQENLRVIQERESIAVDVHDLLGHSLTVINLKAELARRMLEHDPDRARAELEAIAQLSRTSLAEVRSTVTRLRSPDFPGEVEAARRALETVGIAADLPDNPAVAGSNQALFAWALRELVTNVVRHSQATHCRVQVSSQKLQVEDDGIGFDAPGATSTGGLSGLQQRVQEAGGTVCFNSRNQVLITMNGNEDPL